MRQSLSRVVSISLQGRGQTRGGKSGSQEALIRKVVQGQGQYPSLSVSLMLLPSAWLASCYSRQGSGPLPRMCQSEESL